MDLGETVDNRRESERGGRKGETPSKKQEAIKKPLSFLTTAIR